MARYKKILLLFIFCLAIAKVNAARPTVVRDTLIKINITPTAEINPRSRIIEIRVKNSIFKTSYPVKITKEVALGGALYNELVDLIGQLTGPDFKEKTQPGLITSVLDGSNYVFEIVTPAGIKRVDVYEPDKEHYPLLRKLLDLIDRLYKERSK